MKVGRTIPAAASAAILAVFSLACHREHAAERKTKVVWRPVGSWSGHGDAQTDSFEIGFTQVRIRWETRNEKPAGQGTLRVTVNSAVSGRDLAVAVDHNGPGHDIDYVAVEPHWSYLVISSKNLDWSVTVEEPAVVDSP
jgi:hypothetical protein